MNTHQIEKAMAGVPGFVGCFARDQLPRKTTRPAGLIVNTDRSTEAGTHWLCYFIDSNGQSEFFDPLGQPIPKNEILQFAKRNGPSGWPSTVVNGFAYQSETSTKCGDFCIYYLTRRLNGSSICEIHATLSSNASVNDSIV